MFLEGNLQITMNDVGITMRTGLTQLFVPGSIGFGAEVVTIEVRYLAKLIFITVLIFLSFLLNGQNKLGCFFLITHPTQ